MFHRYLLPVCASVLTSEPRGPPLAAPYYFTALSPVGLLYDLDPVRAQYGERPVRGRRARAAVALPPRGCYPAVWPAGQLGAPPAAPFCRRNPRGHGRRPWFRGLDGNGDVAGYARNSSLGFFPWFLPSGSNTATVLPTLNSGDMTYCLRAQQLAAGGGERWMRPRRWSGRRRAGRGGFAALPNLRGGTSSPSQASAISSTASWRAGPTRCWRHPGRGRGHLDQQRFGMDGQRPLNLLPAGQQRLRVRRLGGQQQRRCGGLRLVARSAKLERVRRHVLRRECRPAGKPRRERRCAERSPRWASTRAAWSSATP